MANSIRRKSLTFIRKSLDKEAEKHDDVITDKVKDETGLECPSCHQTGMVLTRIILLNRQLAQCRTI
jgi:hypothetical protein